MMFASVVDWLHANHRTGVGTMAASVVTDTMETTLMGALQLLSSIVLVRWLWSIAWRIKLVRRCARRGGGGQGGGEEGISLDFEGGEASAVDDWATSAEIEASGQSSTHCISQLDGRLLAFEVPAQLDVLGATTGC